VVKWINEKLGGFARMVLDFIFPQGEEERMVRGGGKSAFAIRVRKDSDDKDFISIFKYKDPFIREAIWLLKYRRNLWLAEIFGFFTYEILLEELGDMLIFENFEKPLLIPIPLSKKRLRERGFNQVELVAKEIKKIDSEDYLELDTKILLKTRETGSQTRKNKKEREKNIRGSFAVSNPEKIKGRNIILLDDVLTTGSTMEEAEKTLRGSGAKNIFKLVLGH